LKFKIRVTKSVQIQHGAPIRFLGGPSMPTTVIPSNYTTNRVSIRFLITASASETIVDIEQQHRLASRHSGRGRRRLLCGFQLL
jgi:hypothetical protein